MSNNSQALISVIVPIYNQEMYLGPCAHSLFKQTLDNIEYIFIDDGSEDHSIEVLDSVLKNYPEREHQVKKIILSHNKGVATVRQIGIENATGKYIIHCDSDDWINSDMYERLYLKAQETNADVVGCNFRHEFTDIQYDFNQQYADTIEENIRRLINGKIFPSLCTSLTRRNLIVKNAISFPKGLNMGEDLFFNLQIYLHAIKIVYIEWAPYHYRHTEESSCVQRTRKSIDSDIAIAGMIEKYMREQKVYEKYVNDIQYRKFFSKLPLIHDLNNKKMYNEWLNIYPETNKYIMRYDQIDWKQKTELWLAANKMLDIAKLFLLLIKFKHAIKDIAKKII